MGYAFAYPIFKLLGGSQVACYVHYPTIRYGRHTPIASTDGYPATDPRRAK